MDIRDPTTYIFEGTLKQLNKKFNLTFFNDESIKTFISKNNWYLSTFNDVPEDYYKNEREYNFGGLEIGYALYKSHKIGY